MINRQDGYERINYNARTTPCRYILFLFFTLHTQRRRVTQNVFWTVAENVRETAHGIVITIILL